MGRKLQITIATILALTIASCSSEEGEQTSTPTPTPTATKPKPNKTATQDFNNPVVPPKNSQALTPGSINLIQPTNATERIPIVVKGRSDPFAKIIGQNVPIISRNIPTQAVPVVPPAPVTKKSVAPKSSSRNRAKNATNSNRKPAKPKTPKMAKAKVSSPPKVAVKPKPKPKLTPVVPKVLPPVVPSPTLKALAPPPPEPELARAVEVTGVVQIGQQTQAIIKVPNEATSRYVQPGQRLANGLLVKRIEMNQSSEPTVILEQYGIEVARMVGEAPGGAIQPATADAGRTVSFTAPPPTSVTGAL
ncbi:MAG: hypothetical protein QNJ47_13920 [Nostocaceae cyanobacterium]|nr:hypothetical protein [Nostocaceae cyanobacterium]